MSESEKKNAFSLFFVFLVNAERCVVALFYEHFVFEYIHLYFSQHVLWHTFLHFVF